MNEWLVFGPKNSEPLRLWTNDALFFATIRIQEGGKKEKKEKTGSSAAVIK